MKCHKCGNDNSEKAKFCGGCGSKLSVEPTPTPDGNRPFVAESEKRPIAGAPDQLPLPPPSEKDSWFLVREDKEYGPYTRDLLRQYVSSGKIGINELVRNENGKELRPLSSHVSTSPIDLKKLADETKRFVDKTGDTASELLNKAVKNAGPMGGQLKEQIRGKEKIVLGGVLAALLISVAIAMSGGEPSSGDMEKAVEKATREQLQAFQGMGVEVKILKFKKASCTKSDKGGYHCVSEADINFSGPTGSGVRHSNETNYYFKTSDGWAVTKN